MSPGLNLYAVDDEGPALARLQRLIEGLDDCRLLGSSTEPGRALSDCRRLKPDVVLLDVEMPGTDGVAVARQLAALEPAPAIIFVTAFERYAVDAFELAAVDYLVKPLRTERLARALARVRHAGGARLAGEAVFTARLGDRILSIPVDRARLLVAEDKYTTLHYAGGQALIDESLVSIEERLPGQFLRIHRNALVARPHLRALFRDADGHERVDVDDVDCQPEVSRRNLAAVRAALRQRSGVER